MSAWKPFSESFVPAMKDPSLANNEQQLLVPLDFAFYLENTGKSEAAPPAAEPIDVAAPAPELPAPIEVSDTFGGPQAMQSPAYSPQEHVPPSEHMPPQAPYTEAGISGYEVDVLDSQRPGGARALVGHPQLPPSPPRGMYDDFSHGQQRSPPQV